VKKAGVDLYGGTTGEKTLFDFYGDGDIYLSDIPSSSYQEYEFEISFPLEKKNDWQEKTTYFDFLIGFQGEGSENGGSRVLLSSGGGGGYTPGLTITNEGSEIIAPGCTTAIVSWQTNYFSTSQVIYGTTPGQFNFSLGPEKYGYDFSTVEDSNKITVHHVELTGLISETTYYWRAVSHASPATISYEGTFTTCCPEEDDEEESPLIPPIETITEGVTQGPSGLVVGPGATIPTGGEGEPVGEDLIPEDILTPEEVAEIKDETNNFLAAISGLFGDISSCLILSLFLTLFLILYLMYRRRKEKRDKNNGIYKEKKYDWDLIAILLILLILLFSLKCYILLIPIIITVAYWLYYYFKKDSSL